MVLELFLVAALYYLVLTTLWDLVQRRLESRFGRGYANEAADRRYAGRPTRPRCAARASFIPGWRGAC